MQIIGAELDSWASSLKYQYFAPSGKIFNGMIKIGVFLEMITKQVVI